MRLASSVILIACLTFSQLRGDDSELRDVLTRISQVQGQIKELQGVLDELALRASVLREKERRNGPLVAVIDNVGEQWYRARNAFEMGMRAEEHQDCRLAVGYYTNALQLDAENDSAFLHRGLCYSQLGDPGRAIMDLNESVRLQPNNSQAYLARAEANYARGSYAESIDDLDRAIRRNVQNVSLYTARARAHEKLGQKDLALEDCRKAIEISPNLEQGYMCRARVLLALRRTTEAVLDLNNALALNPKSQDARKLVENLMGLEAQRVAQLVAVSNPVHPEVPTPVPAAAAKSAGNAPGFLANAGVAVVAVSNPARPEVLTPVPAATAKASAKTPGFPANAGVSVQPAPPIKQRLEKETPTLEHSSRKAIALTFEGRDLAARGDYAGAIKLFTQAIQADPALALAYNSRGYAFLRSKQYTRAVADFDDALRLRQDYANAALNLAIAKRLLKRQASVSVVVNPDDLLNYASI